jgi:flagellar motor switch protein FliM
MRVEGRPYTTIERKLMERLVAIFLQDLQASFEPLCKVSLQFDRLETNPSFATIVRPGNAAIITRLRVEMDNRSGVIELLLPYATLEPVRELLLQMFMGEKFGRDAIWETHLANELWNTTVEVQALLDQTTATLKDVLAWKVGTKIVLNATPSSTVAISCGDHILFSGKMGRKNDHIAVQIDHIKYTTKKDD